MSYRLSVSDLARITTSEDAQVASFQDEHLWPALSLNTSLGTELWLKLWEGCQKKGLAEELAHLAITANSPQRIDKIGEMSSWITLYGVITNPDYEQASPALRRAIERHPLYQDSVAGKHDFAKSMILLSTGTEVPLEGKLYIEGELKSTLDPLGVPGWGMFLSMLPTWKLDISDLVNFVKINQR